MNKLNVFKQVASHLLKQNEQAEGQDGCYYRKGNLKCAIGCLIKDECYNDTLEMRTITDPKVLKAVVHSLGQRISDSDLQFLVSLQAIHDDVSPEYWKKSLDKLSKENFQRNLYALGVL